VTDETPPPPPPPPPQNRAARATTPARRPCPFQSSAATEDGYSRSPRRVTILDKENNAVRPARRQPPTRPKSLTTAGSKPTPPPAAFCCPHGAPWDSHGNIYVARVAALRAGNEALKRDVRDVLVNVA